MWCECVLCVESDAKYFVGVGGVYVDAVNLNVDFCLMFFGVWR